MTGDEAPLGDTDRSEEPTPSFDLYGPLPSGRHSVEASAGTGKTYTLAALATRFLAETPHTIDRLLIVTFTRAAAAELRDRVRTRLDEVATALETGAGPADDLTELLARADVTRRAQRLRRAITDFDEATITTIHGFAQQALATLGLGAPGDPDAELVENTRRVVDEVSTDLLVREALRGSAADDLPTLRSIREATIAALANPDIEVIPGPFTDPGSPVVSARAALVREAAREVRTRRRIGGTVAFDDLLTQLRDALLSEGGGPALTELSARYPVVLIDEFQDTDPAQWDIFDALFGRTTGTPFGRTTGETEPRALILVGDPKQAIYSFRGANIHTYLVAAHRDDTHRTTLDRNYRSDTRLVEALDVLLDGATFGDAQIGFVPVGSTTSPDRALTDDAGRKLPALEIHTVTDADLARQGRGKKRILVPGAQAAVAHDLAHRVHELLDGAYRPETGPADGQLGIDPSADRRPVQPSDIAVLIQAHSEAPAIQHALSERGIPSVIGRVGSVMESAAAEQWRVLLTALGRPANARTARAAALSWFWGWSPRDLDMADERVLHDVQTRLHDWNGLLARRGVVELTRRIWARQRVVETLLAASDGDRNLTDLEHIVELLHSSTKGRPISAAGLLAAFEALAEPDQDVVGEVLERRTGSQDASVRILSIHASKGLEFPIVLCPYLWKNRTGGVRVFQDPDTQQRVLDPAAASEKWPTRQEANDRKRLVELERVGEQLRLTYVALTRAKHQVHLWWAPASRSENSPLARILFGRDDEGQLRSAQLVAGPVDLPADADTTDQLAQLVERSTGSIVVDECQPGGTTGLSRTWTSTGAPPRQDMTVAELGRSIDRTNRRWSFSAISAADSNQRAQTIDPDDDRLGDGGSADEPIEPDAPPTGDTAADQPATESDLTLGTIAGGTGFGTLVHEVLEVVDFAAADLTAEVTAEVASALRTSDRQLDQGLLVAGLVEAIETPLGPIFGQRPLRELSRADRLDELSFDIPLAEARTSISDPRPVPGPATEPQARSRRRRGRTPQDDQLAFDFEPSARRHRLTGRAIGGLIANHLPAGDPLRPWAVDVAGGRFRVDLAGSLTGSIDGVFRLRRGDAPTRYVVVDYKTNRLGTWGEPLRAKDYHPDLLPAAMVHHHYPLQALLYSVALHRYLRWRLIDYRPDDHLGGAAYLFLRGMSGARTAMDGDRPYGVFGWAIPTGLVCDLSDLLAGRDHSS